MVSWLFISDDELLGHYENEQYRLYRNFSHPRFLWVPALIVKKMQYTAGIDNFKVWNITGLEIP